jgi:tetratricopeptide (TPR) repeat protein
VPDDKDKPEDDQAEKTASAADVKAGDASTKKTAAVEEPASDEREDDEAEGEGEKEDDARVDVLAKRVEKLGGEDELERIAREEEEKLAARRARLEKKKKGKKGDLEKAASKKLSRIGEKAMPKSTIATAVDAGDPLLDKTAQLSKWLKKNSRQVQYVVAAAVVAAAAFGGWTYYQQRRDEQASMLLSEAISAERGTIGDPDKEDDDNKPKPAYPVFKTAEEKRDTALAKHREVQSKYPGTGAAYLARLAEGSLLLDKGDADGAAGAFRDVLASPLAATDQDVKGRALEGLGFAYELKGSLDEALKTFKELENTVDVRGFKELAMYHQARCLEAKGEKDQAKDLLKTLAERLSKPGDKPGEHPFPYLQEVSEDRLRALDPTAVPPKPQLGGMGGIGGGGHGNMTEQQMKELIEKLKKQAEQAGGGK